MNNKFKLVYCASMWDMIDYLSRKYEFLKYEVGREERSGLWIERDLDIETYIRWIQKTIDMRR